MRGYLIWADDRGRLEPMLRTYIGGDKPKRRVLKEYIYCHIINRNKAPV
jgi:hypothetical protein